MGMSIGIVKLVYSMLVDQNRFLGRKGISKFD